ncbi:MAG: hypothetical protein JWO30_3600 [Fibrobacteres bacterium]|nr:hypothetical protein [Fibrobacterota bacterium]
MQSDYETVLELTGVDLSPVESNRLLQRFALDFGWQPSDTLLDPNLNEFSNGHLIVEHGLESAAVVTFFKQPIRYDDLGTNERKRLLSLSYNNLIDWHIYVESGNVSVIYNRTESPQLVASKRVTRHDFAALRREAFEKITEERPTSNLLALDDALISTISNWKRLLAAEIGNLTNRHFSALFNSIIFARAAEDNRRFRSARAGDLQSKGQVLLAKWYSGQFETVGRLLNEVTIELIEGPIPGYLAIDSELDKFSSLSKTSVASLLSDFYHNKYASYFDYDFSIISKHALSRIYEHYVSILRINDTPQTSLFPELPIEQQDRAYGSVYTPQYIARFFARFISTRFTQSQISSLKIVDPACGSGIFLRTLLESSVEAGFQQDSIHQLSSIFGNIMGADVDENATFATRLSLSLLHLVLTGSLPDSLNIENAEAIEYFSTHNEHDEAFDVVVANPPYVPIEKQSQEMRDKVSTFLATLASGRVDLYVPFLLIALKLLKPGGYGCFVLPHSFLLSKSTLRIRQRLSEDCYIHCIADLSDVRVFGDVGAYPILFIFQKKASKIEQIDALVVKCKEFPGQALQEAIIGKTTENKFFSIYKVTQAIFQSDQWVILPAAEHRINRKLGALRPLSDFLYVKQGVVTGADDIFFRTARDVTKKEREIWISLLKDKEMLPYSVPAETELLLFYPFIDNEKLSENVLRKRFPETWRYLVANKLALSKRSSLERYGKTWWEPMWPRLPEELLRPKLVTPHLILIPRFSIDLEGEKAVTRSPFLYPIESGADEDLLKYFLAILNSSTAFWHLSSYSHRYRGGYLMLEPKTLKNLPVPDPSSVGSASISRIVKLIDKRIAPKISSSSAVEIEKEIDDLVASMYSLSKEERKSIGL